MSFSHSHRPIYACFRRNEFADDHRILLYGVFHLHFKHKPRFVDENLSLTSILEPAVGSDYRIDVDDDDEVTFVSDRDTRYRRRNHEKTCSSLDEQR